MKRRRRRKLHKNPVWVDKVMSDVWDRLVDKVPPELLPVPYEGALSRYTFQEYGCGRFGCVYPTGAPDVVFKVTTDYDEAKFVAYAIKMARANNGKLPFGVVNLYLLAALGEIDVIFDAQEQTRDGYALWREAAVDVGPDALDVARRFYGTDDIDDGLRSLMWVQDVGRFFTSHIYGTKNVDWQAINNSAASFVRKFKDEELPDSNNFYQLVQHYAGANTLHLLGSFYGGCMIVLDRMADRSDAFRGIGEAMLYYMKLGAIMVDVRPDNMGWVIRPSVPDGMLVITDPGLTVVISPDGMHPSIPSVERVDRANWLTVNMQ